MGACLGHVSPSLDSPAEGLVTPVIQVLSADNSQLLALRDCTSYRSHLAKVMLSSWGPHLMALTWEYKDPSFLSLLSATLTQRTKCWGRNANPRAFIPWSDVQILLEVFDFYFMSSIIV